MLKEREQILVKLRIVDIDKDQQLDFVKYMKWKLDCTLHVVGYYLNPF